MGEWGLVRNPDKGQHAQTSPIQRGRSSSPSRLSLGKKFPALPMRLHKGNTPGGNYEEHIPTRWSSCCSHAPGKPQHTFHCAVSDGGCPTSPLLLLHLMDCCNLMHSLHSDLLVVMILCTHCIILTLLQSV